MSKIHDIQIGLDIFKIYSKLALRTSWEFEAILFDMDRDKFLKDGEFDPSGFKGTDLKKLHEIMELLLVKGTMQPKITVPMLNDPDCGYNLQALGYKLFKYYMEVYADQQEVKKKPSNSQD